MTSGFNFSGGGFNAGSFASTTKPVGFALPSSAAATSTAGFSLGGGASATSTGFSLGSTPATGVPTLSGLLGAQTPASSATSSALGQTSTAGTLTLGATTTSTPGFSLGSGLGGTQTGGLTFGTPSTAATSTGFGLGGGLGLNLGTSTATSTPANTGFGLGGTATANTGLTLGTTATSAAGFSLGGSTGVGFGGGLGATSKPGLTLGATQPASTGFSLGGGGLASGTGTGIFAGVSTSTSRGLGGVDPKTTSTGVGTASTSDKTGDSKVVKESQVPPEICATVEEFEKYVRAQKDIREKSARKSSKPLYRVQENIASLKQTLYLVSNALQRNAVAIEKMKHESAQELKHVEIAQRTKETPPGLQYENTAPLGYFVGLVDEFERRMIQYRQQIEEMENHLTALGQTTTLSPQELTQLLRKLYESFVALAAQLQNVHESVKVQKEHYLNYRQVFLSDNTDIFEKRRKTKEATGVSVITTTYGPTPFTGMTNQVAYAMATALNRPQQPSAAGFGLNTGAFATGAPAPQQPSLGGTGTGLFGAGASSFGSAFKPAVTTQQSGFGGGFGSSFGGFGTNPLASAATNTATVRPLG